MTGAGLNDGVSEGGGGITGPMLNALVLLAGVLLLPKRPLNTFFAALTGPKSRFNDCFLKSTLDSFKASNFVVDISNRSARVATPSLAVSLFRSLPADNIGGIILPGGPASAKYCVEPDA